MDPTSSSALRSHSAPYRRKSPPPSSRRSPPPTPRRVSPSPTPSSRYPPSLSHQAHPLTRSRMNGSISDTTNDDHPMDEINTGQPGSGGYAYSTTLRRQASLDPVSFPSSSSSLLENPYRKRATSNTNGYRVNPSELIEGSDGLRNGDGGVVSKIMGRVRGILGKRGYEEISRDDEDRRISAERRAQETPSAIFAHKTVAVCQYHYRVTTCS